MKIFLIFLVSCYVSAMQVLEFAPNESEPIPLSNMLTEKSIKTAGDQLSWCVMITLSALNVEHCIFAGFDASLVIRNYEKSGFVDIRGIILHFPIMTSFTPYKWTDVCVTFHTDTFRVYIDSALAIEETNPKLKDKTFSENILDVVNFMPKEWFNSEAARFHGKVSNLNMWSQELSFDDILRFYNGSQDAMPMPDIFDWNDVQTSAALAEGVVVKDEELGDLIADKHEKDKVVLLPDMDIAKSSSECEYLGGEAIFPTNFDDAQLFHDLLANDETEVCNTIIHTPLVKDPSNPLSQFRHIVSDKVVPLVVPWRHDQPNGGDRQPCLSLFYQNNKLLGADTACTSNSLSCYACRLRRFQQFIFQGLQLQEDFYLRTGTTYEKPTFAGSKGSLVMFDNDTWKILDINGDIIHNIHLPSIPIGKQSWNIPGQEQTVFLKMTQCDDTCDYGQCLPMEQRCDGTVDCNDKSDEWKCSLVPKLNEDYIKETPPPSRRDEKAMVNVSITLRSIFDIRELDMSLKLGFSLTLTWNDPRLSFHNLKEDQHTNILPHSIAEAIWILGLLFQNSLGNAKVGFDEDSLVFISRNDQGELHSRYDMPRDLIYDGATNPVNFEKSYELPFKCDFELHNYPFDVQQCEIALLVPRNLHDYVGIHGDTFQYVGKTGLVQFYVNSWNLVKANDSLLIATFVLERNALYHIVATFLPTTSLVIIAESTLFISEVRFEATIMVAMTAKLVTYTFYQSIGATLPQTSYIKLIDIWLLFVMMMPFFVFLHLVLCEICKGDGNKVGPGKAWEQSKSKKFCWKTVSKSLIIGTTVVFITGFFILAAIA